jgi:hypothetical protein
LKQAGSLAFWRRHAECAARESEEIYNEIVIVKFFMVQVLTKGLYTISSIAVPLCMQSERETSLIDASPALARPLAPFMFPVAVSLISMQIGAGKNRARDDNEKEAESERCEKGRQAKINCRLKDLKFVLGGEINSITVPARARVFGKLL